MREEDLGPPVVRWLEGQGYSVSAEVRNCDIVARHPLRPDELVVVELKRRMSLDLVAQGVRRQEHADGVYVAVPLEGSGARLNNFAAVRAVLERLSLGLLVVRRLANGTRIEVVLHPGEGRVRNRPTRRRAIIREIDARYAELDRAGAATDRRRYTAYRQAALAAAFLLAQEGEASPARLRSLGARADVGRVLGRNVYGWFERVRRGVYRLHPAGREALEREADAVARIASALAPDRTDWADR